ncbi:hypothetical protein [Streptomyces sp. AS58]|uniref:hypothetical protein n=1 Tax=Streptomyces sp. AS58 TaxID=1519489 RepID=UPI00131E8D25|nr:hypothetical protein [Streptomyces sp. AS58]
MKIVIWSFLALFFTVGAIGGLLSAANGHDAPSVFGDLLVSAVFARGAWASWKRASRPEMPRIARIEEPHVWPWRRR